MKELARSKFVHTEIGSSDHKWSDVIMCSLGLGQL